MAWRDERLMRALRPPARRRRPLLGGLLAVVLAGAVVAGVGADAMASPAGTTDAASAHARTAGAHAAACRPAAQPGNPPVVFLPGGVRALAHGTLPSGGLSYQIEGQRYRFEGCVYFDLSLDLERPGLSIPDSGGGSSFTPAQAPGALSYSDQQVCQPHAVTIVFGLLRAPHDRVLVRSTTAAATARVVAIPAALHSGGALAYAALPGELTEVSVQAGGRTVLDDRLPSRGPCRAGSLIILP